MRELLREEYQLDPGSIEYLIEEAAIEGADEPVRLVFDQLREGNLSEVLYLLSQVVAMNRGTFLISSGTATLVGYLRKREVVFDAYRHSPWQGTVVSVIIDLTKDLPILDVYRTTPAPEGYADDDFFN